MQRIKVPFAQNGDKTAIPDAITLDGSVNNTQGYTSRYDENPAPVEQGGSPTAKVVGRTDMNYILWKSEVNQKTWQEQTFPDWIEDDGEGVPFAYPKNAIVKYTNGNIYVSLANNNTQIPTGANWKLFDITALDNTVKLSGNQTIEGVKTFSSSPAAPTPTTGTQVANKDYVDTKQSKSEISYYTNTSNYIPNTLSSGAIIEIGSNANGQYIAFADGTLICRNNAVNFISNSGGQWLYFPLSFIGPGYSMEITYLASFRTQVTTFNYNPLTGSYAHIFSNVDGELNVSYVAIGRWK